MATHVKNSSGSARPPDTRRPYAESSSSLSPNPTVLRPLLPIPLTLPPVPSMSSSHAASSDDSVVGVCSKPKRTMEQGAVRERCLGLCCLAGADEARKQQLLQMLLTLTLPLVPSISSSQAASSDDSVVGVCIEYKRTGSWWQAEKGQDACQLQWQTTEEQQGLPMLLTLPPLPSINSSHAASSDDSVVGVCNGRKRTFASNEQ